MKNFTREELISKILSKYPDLDFDKDFAIGPTFRNIFITYRCRKHGAFKSSLYHLLIRKHYCKECAKKYYSFEPNRDIEVIQKMYPNLDFRLFKPDTKSSKGKSIVICKEHGEFLTSFESLKRKYLYNKDKRSNYGCPLCNKEVRKNSIIKKTANARLNELIIKYPQFDFSLFEYKSHSYRSKVICREHGVFETSVSTLLYKRGVACPECVKTYSSAELEIYEYLKLIYSGFIDRNNRNIIPSPKSKNHFLEIDIYLPDINLGIEYNGYYWHSRKFIKYKAGGVFKSIKQYHEYKTTQCFDKGIDLIHIREKDYKRNKRKILENIKYIVNSRQNIYN